VGSEGPSRRHARCAPAPGEEPNDGEVSEAREAATLILLRDSHRGPEVLLVKRNPEQRFMGGAWVFPGGATQPEDADELQAALRELGEEAGITLPPDAEPIRFSRWITPAEVSVRFDTHFFVAPAPEGLQPRVDGDECVDARWLRPGDALAAGERGEILLVFPTVKHLEQLQEFESVAAALAAARQRKVQPVQPKVLVDGGVAQVLLPGEPGYD
jgi:8-oxo-dGTP pyrophosphatase MutT (NUDIX family)